MNPALGLVKRFNKKEAALAQKISNDIAEDFDCRETREQLRMAVAYYADMACEAGRRAADAEFELTILRSAKEVMGQAPTW